MLGDWYFRETIETTETIHDCPSMNILKLTIEYEPYVPIHNYTTRVPGVNKKTARRYGKFL
jgi:hypothetical protein